MQECNIQSKQSVRHAEIIKMRQFFKILKKKETLQHFSRGSAQKRQMLQQLGPEGEVSNNL